jgi:H+-translocating NAD(P) transhydrogenase subunit alpha
VSDLNNIMLLSACTDEVRIRSVSGAAAGSINAQAWRVPTGKSAQSRLTMGVRGCVGGLLAAASIGAWADAAPVHTNVTAEDIAINLLIFILSSFLGLGLIHGVAKLLHTPLMALTNAISSVSVVAALIVLSYPDNSPLVITLATVGTALALSNVISGFMITERILKMFRKGSR